MPNPQSSAKWYHGIIPVFLALIMLGPFGLPLLWKSPKFNLFWKTLISVLVVLSTIWMIKATAGIVDILVGQIREIQQAGLV